HTNRGGRAFGNAGCRRQRRQPDGSVERHWRPCQWSPVTGNFGTRLWAPAVATLPAPSRTSRTGRKFRSCAVSMPSLPYLLWLGKSRVPPECSAYPGRVANLRGAADSAAGRLSGVLAIRRQRGRALNLYGKIVTV